MEAQLIAYFAAEKQSSLVFMSVGVLVILASVWIYKNADAWRGMVYPLVAIAVIEFVVGATVYFRTDAQVVDLVEQLRTTPAEFQAGETERMETVMASFKVYKTAEVVVLLAGIVLMLAMPGNVLWRAVGAGLIVQCVILLVLDYFAEVRAATYMEALRSLPG